MDFILIIEKFVIVQYFDFVQNASHQLFFEIIKSIINYVCLKNIHIFIYYITHLNSIKFIV